MTETEKMHRVVVKPFSKERFELVQDYTLTMKLSLNGEIVKLNLNIPSGFKTNGADIPRMFWSIYPPNSPEYLTAIVIHDWLCEKAKSKADYKLADKALYTAMLNLGCSKFKSKVFYLACRAWHSLKGWL